MKHFTFLHLQSDILSKDILDMASHLRNTGVTTGKVDRSGRPYQDPAAEGME